MKINNSVVNCNFTLGTQVALKTLVSVIPFLLFFFDGAIGGQDPLPPPSAYATDAWSTASWAGHFFDSQS